MIDNNKDFLQLIHDTLKDLLGAVADELAENRPTPKPTADIPDYQSNGLPTMQCMYHSNQALGDVPLMIEVWKMDITGCTIHTTGTKKGSGKNTSVLPGFYSLPLFDWPEWATCVAMEKHGGWMYYESANIVPRRVVWEKQEPAKLSSFGPVTPWLANVIEWDKSLLMRPEGVR